MIPAIIILGMVCWLTIGYVVWNVEEDRRLLEDAEADIELVMSWCER